MPIEFGIFDHIERIPGVSLQQLYRDRLEFVQLAERGGFTGGEAGRAGIGGILRRAEQSGREDSR
jgi:hypothetical protein